MRVNTELRWPVSTSSLAPCRYWLSVSPVVGKAGSGVLASYNKATLKYNATGDSAVNTDNGFLFWTAGGTNFAPRSLDYSMGLAGTAVPKPSAAMLLVGGVVAMLLTRRSVRKK
ncbi:hypothetical protein Fuma_06061 [Fuerstiella marisgermanici]|uniref:PEP-CTERM protein-sorting domain-containing protein n=1 Tax=Fuerstiella marisgermanici TaxID=1891926 RepID=A0A1P8WQR6_9PLAN|nr:hypothetical protein Fuma_06061 [Fuerstiella marisgermanici]